MVKNGSDIHHPRNEEERYKLMQEAVIDAIERVAPVEVQVQTRLSVEETRGAADGMFTEAYEFNTQQRTRIAWSRTEEFRFQRHPEQPRLWTCTVSGTVRELQVLNTVEAPRAPLERGSAYVARKQGGQVHVRMTSDQRLAPGDQLEIHRPGQGAARVSAKRNKPTGHMVVTDTAEGVARGRLVSGLWSARVQDHVRSATFSQLRGGIRFRHGTLQEPVWIVDEERFSTYTSHVFSFDLFEQSLTNNLGYSAGFDLFHDQVPGYLPIISFIPRIGMDKGFAILPEVLFITPGLSAGLAFHAIGMDDVSLLQLHLQPSLEAVVRWGALDLTAGIVHRITLDNAWLSGPMPTIGFRVDLYRSSPRLADNRRKASFGGIMDHFSRAMAGLRGVE